MAACKDSTMLQIHKFINILISNYTKITKTSSRLRNSGPAFVELDRDDH